MQFLIVKASKQQKYQNMACIYVKKFQHADRKSHHHCNNEVSLSILQGKPHGKHFLTCSLTVRVLILAGFIF